MWPGTGPAGGLMLISAHRLGLVARRLGAGLAGPAGRIQGPGDFLVAEAGLAGSLSEGAQVGGGVGLERAVGGPVQAGVAVALPLAGEPAGQGVQVPVRGRAGISALPLRRGGQRAAGALPAQGAVAAGSSPREVGVAVDLGGRGQDVAAGQRKSTWCAARWPQCWAVPVK